MDNCKYTLKNGTSFESYAELFNYFSEVNIKDFQSLSDVVYSKFKKRDAVREQLITLSKQYVPKSRIDSVNSAVSTIIDGEPQIRESGVISISDWIDHPSCMIDGNPLITQLVTEDYIESEINILVKTKNIEREEAEKIVNTVVNNWKIIEEDSIFLHSLFTAKQIGNLSEFENIENVSTKLGLKLADKLHNNLERLIKIIHSQHPNSTRLTNINLRTELEGFDKDLIGHIDYMFIDARGTLHIYNFKTTHTHPSEWSSAKESKYKMQLAFLKQMLANKGIQVKNMSLNIVPVQLTYDENFKTIQDIFIHAPKLENLNRFSNPALNKYFAKAKHFVKSNIAEPEGMTEGLKNANAAINATFPELNIKAEGIETSAKEWIKNAPSSGDSSTPIIIKPIGNPDHGYDLIINGEVIPIKSNKRIENNTELEEKVKEHIKDLEDNKQFITSTIVSIIEKGVKQGYLDFSGVNQLKGIRSTHLELILNPYIAKDSDGKSEWEFNDSLVDQNIFLFTNKKTGQTDVISLSHLNLNATVKINGTTNILGSYKQDSMTKTLKSHYGNIETVRTLLLLNSLYPEMEFDNMKLGQIKVVSALGHSRIYDIGHLTKNYLPEIFTVVKQYNPDLKIQNNLKSAEFVNYTDVLIKIYNDLMQSENSWNKDRIEKLGFDALSEAETTSQQILALESILQQLFEHFPSVQQLNLQKSIKSNAIEVKLFELVSNAYKQLTGQYPNYSDNLTWLDVEVTTAATVPNKNINLVVTNFLMTADSIAEDTLSQWQKYRPSLMQYYKSIGYSPTQNATIGNQTSQFNRLYDKENMMFKNPYDTNSDLTSQERILLKNVLSHLYEIRKTFHPELKEITDIEQYIEKNPSYLQVPLIRASGASKLQSVDRMKNSWGNLLKVLKSPEKYWDEFVEKILPEDAQTLDEDFEQLSLTNNFERQYRDQQYRSRIIQKHGFDYFETNVEDILLTVLNKYVQTDKMNKFLIGTKNLIFQLEMLEGLTGTKSIIDEEVKYIKDYIKVNVFSRSIMGETGKKVTSALTPLKRAVTTINLAGNVVSAIRDTEQGLIENFVRTITKFQTDLSAKSVRDAYAYVVTHGVNNAMNISKLSALCAKYRISNSDLNRITERLRSGRGGVLNADNWAYSTLRGPDFLNRMVLFVARCMEDGCWDALSVKNDILEYNWKEDKRFAVYASGNKEHADYKKQRSLYLSKIQEYNEEHPENQLEYDDRNEIHLPEPYSRKEILSIRNVDRNIYGSYDKSMKAMGEHTAKWWAFGMYTTWMNGIYNNYFMKPGESQVSQRKLEQQRNENGELLFFDEDGGLTTEDTGVPYVKGVPMIVQGIWYTCKEMFSVFKNDGLTHVKKYLSENESARQNLNKLLSDLLINLLYLVLIKLALSAEYKNYKKTMKDNPVIQNLIVEVMYKSTSRAWDSFQGPLNIINFVGENMNPPVYQIPMKLISDTGKFLFGEKTFLSVVTGNLAIGRSYKDTYNAYLKSQK